MQSRTTENAERGLAAADLPSLDGIAHKASNEALSILMGINMLSSLPEEAMTPHQVRALKLMETSASNLVQLMEDLKSKNL